LREALGRIPVQAGKPTFVIANTVKGRGVSFMEDIAKWHHGVPSDEQYQQAMEEFDQQLTLLEKNGFNSQI
jgi:transketolase